MELFCEYFNFKLASSDEIIYICRVTGFNRFSPSGQVNDIHGTHLEGKSNIDVHSLIILNHQIKNFPRYLCNFFPNLKSISVISCGLQRLTKSDLIGCERIQKLMLNGNDIFRIAPDVFENTPNLETISFYKNDILNLPEIIFDGLKKLKNVNLERNLGLNWSYLKTGKRDAMDEIKKKLIDHNERPKITGVLYFAMTMMLDTMEMDLEKMEKIEKQENYRREVMKLYNLI